MQYQKKNLWLVALASALALAFASGCDDKPTTPTTPTGPTPTPTPKVHEWKPVTKGTTFNPTGDAIDKIAASTNGKWLYATADVGKELWVADLDVFANINVDSKWVKKAFNNTALAGGAGLIKDLTANANSIWRLDPTQGGVITSMVRLAGPAANGGAAALLIGPDYKAAWAPISGAATHLAGDPAADTQMAFAGLLKRADGKEFVYAGTLSDNDARTIATFSTINAEIGADGSGVAHKLNVRYTTAANPAFGRDDGAHFYANAAQQAFVINSTGARTYADQLHVGVNTAGFAAPAPQALSGAPWTVDSGAENDSISAVLGVGDYLYIAFGSDGTDDKGGVRVINARTLASSPAAVHKDWKNVPVKALTADPSGKVFAVTKTYLVEVKNDGSPGAKLTATGDKNAALPADNINDAKFVGDNLVIATNDKGLVVRYAAK